MSANGLNEKLAHYVARCIAMTTEESPAVEVLFVCLFVIVIYIYMLCSCYCLGVASCKVIFAESREI